MNQFLDPEEPTDDLSPIVRSAVPGVTHGSDFTLLDGGASHDVCIGSTIPKGSIEKDVKSGHGSKKGYVKDGCITFVDRNTSSKGETPKLISLGRLIQQRNLRFAWTRAGARLELPKGKTNELKIDNHCPYVGNEVLEELIKLKRKRAWRLRRWKVLQPTR